MKRRTPSPNMRLDIGSHINVRGERRAKRARSSAMLDCPSRWQILQSNTAASLEGVARLGYSPEKLRVMLQAIVEPVLLALEADQHAGWLPVPRDEDLLRLGQAEESGQIVLDLSQGYLAHLASRARQASASLRLW